MRRDFFVRCVLALLGVGLASSAISEAGDPGLEGTGGQAAVVFERVPAPLWAGSTDHGDSLDTAVAVDVPSTTRAEIGVGGDRDWFRVRLSPAGLLTARTTGRTDTYGTLFDRHGRELARNDDGAEAPNYKNFKIERQLRAGFYYIEVRGFNSGTTGSYALELTRDGGTPTPPPPPPETPDADAPAVAITAVPAGDEGTRVRLSATLTGGAYDGSPTYAWRATGGTLSSSSAASPTWTRPSVTTNTSHMLSLTVTVRGTGTSARSGTSDTASASRSAIVQNVGSGDGGVGDGIDQGDSRATAATVDVPSTTRAELDPAGDLDWFRFTLASEGPFTAETTGGTDTYGTLYDSSGSVLENDDDDGGRNNFHIERRLAAGTYYVEVSGYDTVSTTGPYTLVLTGDGATTPHTPDADAPTVTITAVPAGSEGTRVRLSATLTGGGYDGSPTYAWSVTGGSLSSSSAASPTWTRPSVTSNTNYTVRLTVTVRGTGSNAENATSDTASASATALVRNTGGGDGGGGDDDDDDGGDQGGSRATAEAVDVPSTTRAELDPGGDRDWFRFMLASEGPFTAETTGGTDTYGTLYDSSGSVLENDDDDGERINFHIERRLAAGTYYVEVSGYDTVSTTGPYTLVLTGDGATTPESPDADAPTVTITAVPAGDEGTGVQLSATLTGGSYDGSPTYAWRVTGGSLSSSSAASPTWTRPSVSSNTNYTVRLTVTVRGTGSNAKNATSDTASASATALVRNTGGGDGGGGDDDDDDGGDQGGTRATAASVSVPSTTRGEIVYSEGGDRDYFRFTLASFGTFTAETTGGTDTYGTLFDTSGRELARDDDDGFRNNFHIEQRLPAGTYFLEVRGYNRSSTGSYTLELTGDGATTPESPDADAPTVSITAVSAGDEGTGVQLSATVTGGSYDGSPTYAWSVTGGTLSSPSAASPIWRRPSVSSDTNYTVRLTVTVRGTGSNAKNGTSESASASTTSLVRDTGGGTSRLRIAAVPEGGEGSAVTLRAIITRGAYVGTPTYAWSVSGGTLSSSSAASPTWTRPPVDDFAKHRVRLTVTARDGTSDSASITAIVREQEADPLVAPRLLWYNSWGIYAGAEDSLYGGESLRLTMLREEDASSYDTISYSWSVSGGGELVPIPGRTRKERIIAYRAPARVTTQFTATVSCRVTIGGNGITVHPGQSHTLTYTHRLTVLPNPTGAPADLRGPTTERGDTYADGYAFWNGGQAVDLGHNPWLNVTPGRVVTYSFPEGDFTRHNREMEPLRREASFKSPRAVWTTQALREQFRQAFDLWEQYVNVRFQEVKDDQYAHLLIGRRDISFGRAFMISRGDMNSGLIGLGIEYDDLGRLGNIEVPLHEIGHALGLGHPHTQGAGANLDDAIMEYRHSHNGAKFYLDSPATLEFPADIIAAQHIWGNAPGAPRTVPDVSATATLTYDSVADELVATWAAPKINGGAPVSGWVVEWLLDSDPAETNTPLGGGSIERTDTIDNPATLRATYSSPTVGDWSVQVRAKNAVGLGLRKRAPATGDGVTVN